MDALGFVPAGLVVVPLIWTLMRPQEQLLIVRFLHWLWPLVRPVLGWFFLVVGVLGVIFPILQGVVFLVLGAALIGPRHRVIRWSRAQYRLLLRRWQRSRSRLLSWVGRQGRSTYHALARQIRRSQTRWQVRSQRRRRFRVVIVPDPVVMVQLNRWRARYDPSLRRALPPHIVVIAASLSADRAGLEAMLARVCRETCPFELELSAPEANAPDRRLVCVLGEGSEALWALRRRLEPIVAPEIRFSQRPTWPSLTIGKLRQEQTLASAYAEVAEEFRPLHWRADALTIYEERFGHLWYRVRTLPFLAGNDA